MSVYTLNATVRDRAGKGAARETRRNGQIPAVIYGDNQAPQTISVEASELRRHLAATFFTHVYELNMAGKAHRVLPRDVQFCPLTDKPLHVDFLRVSATTKITVKVPLEFINQDKSPGIKAGGVLNIVHHELELRVTPDKIPEHITIDLSGRNIGDSIHVSDANLDKDIEVLAHGDDPTLATIAAQSAIEIDTETAIISPADVPATSQKAPEKK